MHVQCNINIKYWNLIVRLYSAYVQTQEYIMESDLFLNVIL
jgi:hypothetical protein